MANFNRKEHLRHRAVFLRQHGFLVRVVVAAVVFSLWMEIVSKVTHNVVELVVKANPTKLLADDIPQWPVHWIYSSESPKKFGSEVSVRPDGHLKTFLRPSYPLMSPLTF